MEGWRRALEARKGTSAAQAITIRGMTKTYGRVHALDHVDLDIRSGEFLTLLGPSGSGKTTLLMVLAGFTRPDHGSLRIGDDEMIRTPPHARNIGMVFQSYALFPHMTVAGNIGYPLRLRRLAKAEITARVEQALETVQLAGYGERRVDQLSGGQKQRVALARAIVFEPRILLMDEPLSALDKKLRERMQIELRHLHDKLGMTTVYVTHDQREALTMSDRIAVINFGRVMQLGVPETIYNRPANRFVADFIGESTFLPVRREAGRLVAADVALEVAGEVPAGDRLLLVVRPERLHLLAPGEGAGMNRLEARVRDVVYQGDSFLLYAVLADGTEIAKRGVVRAETIASLPRPGETAAFGLEPRDTVLIVDDGTGGEDGR
ncbi:MAG: polyamine ABC transporter ATP-binding protein [Rhizobiales bacterium]|nr:polyamine ABC transporter ATP-binding protein [Hyphomicrobiales bacterium]